jgi:outer membrane receptor for ferrienterochelin and colicin
MKVKSFLYLLLFLGQIAYSGTTGKISGVVVDASSNEPLPGANVIIEGTTMGAATNLEGQYSILNVPPGVYTLRAGMIGYQATRVKNVNVSIDLTTEIDFSLPETVLEMGESVTIVAERPMVVKDLTASTAIVGAEEMEALPVTEVNEAIELQAGLIKDAGGGLHVRGGRSGEISYWVDGISITDVYDGGTVVDINKNMVQELQVITGAFNAEYGQAMSGIVNIATKAGSNRFGGNISAYFGDHISNHDNAFMYIDNINPAAIRNIEASLHGAIVKDKLFYYANARAIHFDGWLYGQRRFNPHALTSTVILEDDFVRNYAPEYLENARFMENGGVGFQYVHGSNPYVDSLSLPFIFGETTVADPDSFAHYYNLLTNANADGRGDQEYVPMNSNDKLYGQLKLIYNFTPSLKLSYSAIYDNVEYSDFERDYLYNPDGALNRFRTGLSNFFQVTHVLNDKTFYRLGVANFQKTYKHYVYENRNDSRYVHPDMGIQQAYSFKTAGTDLSHFKRQTNTMLAKLDLTSQITNTHQVKAGVEIRKHRVEQEDISLRPVESDARIDPFREGTFIDTRVMPQSSIYYSSYKHKPAEFSAYIQDKMEFKKMIVNVGVRMDYFEPDGVILSDPSDPSIYNPIRPENRYYDYGTDGVPNTHDSDGSENNNIWDEGEPEVSLAERQEYWYKDATSKFAVSPRLGVSFPITDRGVFHFSYGHFFQIPRFERLYQNPDFEMESGTGNVGVIGNADLEPEQTVSGEIGLQQQITNDVSIGITGYFRDIRNLAGTRAEEIELFGGAAKYSKFVNSDFGLVKGLVLSINKRFSGGLSASFDYTLQQAKGSNSDPEQARNALDGGSLPEVQLTPLNWDQKHTINGTVSYNGPSWGVSLIGQWGSGLPYTPRQSQDITALLTNSQRKPTTYNLDLRAYKEIKFGPGGLTVFLRIQNLFDTMNELNVYDTTGRAGYTLDQQIAEATNPMEIINSLNQWFSNPTHYSEPRRIEAGFSYTF